MVLHADAVAQNCAAGIGARRIDRDDAYRPVFLAIVSSELIHQRALPRAGGARESKDARMSAVRKESLKQFGPSQCAVLDRADGTGEGARIAGANLVDQGLDTLIQTVSV